MDDLKPIDPSGDIQKQIEQHQQHRIDTGSGVAGCYCAGCVEVPSKFIPKPKPKDDKLQEDSMFTGTEEAIFDMNIQYRQAVLEDIFKDGIPKDNSTRRIVNELLSSVDSALLTRAKTRYGIIANKAEQNANSNTMEILKGIIQQRIQQTQHSNNVPIPETIPKEYMDVELNEGALKLGADNVSVKDFFNDSEE